MASRRNRMSNLTKLLVGEMTGEVNTVKVKKASQYMIGSRFALTRKLIQNLTSIYHADLMSNRILITTEENKYEIYPILTNKLGEPFLASYKHPLRYHPLVGLPCHTWGDNCSFIIGSGTGSYVLIIDVESTTIIEEFNLNGDDPRMLWSTMGHEVCPYKNNLIAVACRVGKVPIIDLRTGNVETATKEIIPDVNCISWSRFHEHIIALTSSSTETLQIWDIRHLKNHYSSIAYRTYVPPNLQFLDHSTLLSLRESGLDFVDVFSETISYSLPIDVGGRTFKRKQFAFDCLAYPQYFYIPTSENVQIYDLFKDSIVKSYTTSLFPPEIVLMNEISREVFCFTSNEVCCWRQSFYSNSDDN